jgi:hypothetical protein
MLSKWKSNKAEDGLAIGIQPCNWLNSQAHAYTRAPDGIQIYVL